MSQPIEETRVRRIAELSRLNLTPDEVSLFAGQFGNILEYIEQLRAVDTDHVEPLAHPLVVHNVLRDDAPAPFANIDAALANAPQRAGRFFKVPPVLDQNGGA
jgi:aspartyl-tRNA(Asn)/glutamyl-tRNA(Gln) amidotransferase subunit C